MSPRAFVVPGLEIAQAHGLDLAGAGLEMVATPRHASVLVLVGELPAGLARAASLAYTQMPRPRALLAVGASEIASLPAPDVAVPIGQEALAAGVAALRRRIVEGSFSQTAPAFDVAAPRRVTEYACPMHLEVVQAEPGSCPVCGMGLVPREAAQVEQAAPPTDHGGRQHQPARAPAREYTCPMHPQVVQGEPGTCPMCGMNLERREAASSEAGAAGHEPAAPMEHTAHGDAEHAGMDHSAQGMNHTAHGMDHTAHGMDHTTHGMEMDHGQMSGGGFMSMVMMTRDLPRSADGLPMEWLDVPFGPLFPGLPGGLALSLTLDGDTVAQAKLEPGTLRRALEASWPGPVEGFVERFVRLDPLSPAAYRALAERTLQAATSPQADPTGRRQWVGILERERAASHLLWLRRFAFLLGDRGLEQRGTSLRQHVSRARDPSGVRRVRQEARALVHHVDRTPLLARRLSGVGSLDHARLAELDGPASRAAGLARDARTDDSTYHELGFRPLVLEGGDALARLRLRLAELEQSLELLLLAGPGDVPPSAGDPPRVGTGQATVETPRGAATLRIEVVDGHVARAELWSPSQRLVELIRPVAEGRELADALLGIASLDLSPWELDR